MPMMVTMVDLYKDAIDSIDCVQVLTRGSSNTSLQLNERQCQVLAQELAETRVFLDNKGVCSKFGQDVGHILLHLCSTIKRVELLVKKCCCKDSESWLVATMVLVDIQEEFAAMILDIHLWRMLLDFAIASAKGLSCEKKAEEMRNMDEEYHRLFKELRRETHILQQAALEDKRILLLRIAEIHGSTNDLEDLRAIYVQSWLTHSLVGTENAAHRVMELNKYECPRVLGIGSCGTVLEVKWLGVCCALKMLNVQDEREATALKGLFHPNIIRLFHYWEDPPHNPKSHLLMELMPRDLGNYMEGLLKSMPSSSKVQMGKDMMLFSLPVVIDIMYQIAQAMRYMHGKNLTHRDLKPSNILVKERANVGLTDIDGEGYLDIKLADFGLVKHSSNASTIQAHTMNTGTPIYGAPEIFGKDLILKRNFLQMADVWSFGITCAEILSGKKPYAEYANESRLTIQRRIFNEGLRPTLPKDCPSYLAFCITSSWELLPERRPDFASICRFLRYAKLLSLGVMDLDDSKLFFAYITQSGYVKGLYSSRSSLNKRLSAFFKSPLKLIGHLGFGVQSRPKFSEGRIGFMASSSTTTKTANKSLDLETFDQAKDVGTDEGEDPSFSMTPTTETMISSSFAHIQGNTSSDLGPPAVELLDSMVKDNAAKAKEFMETPEALKAILHCLDKDAENPSSQKCAFALLNMATEVDDSVRLGIANIGLGILVKFVRNHGTGEFKELLTTMLGLICKHGNDCEEAIIEAGGHTFLLTSLEENISKGAAAQGLLSLINDARTRGDVLEAGFVAIATGSIDRNFAITEMAFGLASICSTAYGLDQIEDSPCSVQALLILLERCPTIAGKGAAAAIIAKLYTRLYRNEDYRHIELTKACAHLIKYLDLEDKSQHEEFLKALAAFATGRNGRQMIHDEQGLTPLIQYLNMREIDTQVRYLLLKILAEMSSVIQEGVLDRVPSYHWILDRFLDNKIGEVLCLLFDSKEFSQNTESLKNLLMIITNLSLAGPTACDHLSEYGVVTMLLNVLKDHKSLLSTVTELAVKALVKFVDEPSGKKTFVSGEGLKYVIAVLKLSALTTSDVTGDTIIILLSVTRDPRTRKVACKEIFSHDILPALNAIMFEGETTRIKYQVAVLLKLLATYGPTTRVCAAMYQTGCLDALRILCSVQHCEEFANDVLKFVSKKNGDCKRYINSWPQR